MIGDVIVGLITLTATRADRLDKVVVALLPELSRSAAQRLIAQGACKWMASPATPTIGCRQDRR